MPFITPLELKENKTSDKITIVFGRFQPPTLGHKALFDAAIEKGIIENSDVILVPTRTCEKRKIEETNIGENIKTQLSKSKDLCSTIRYPLKYDEKKHFIRTLYPESIFPNYYFLEIPETRIEGLNLNVYIDLLIFLNKYVGYKELYFIAGDDVLIHFKQILKKEITKVNYLNLISFMVLQILVKGDESQLIYLKQMLNCLEQWFDSQQYLVYPRCFMKV